MSLRAAEITIWAAIIVTQAALAFRLKRFPPLFRTFLAFNLLRDSVNFAVFLLGHPATAGATEAYRLAYTIGTPIDIVLLGLAGIEAAAMIAPAAAWTPIAFATLLWLLVWRYPQSLDGRASLWLFVSRGIVCGSVFASLLASAVWCRRLPRHALILAVFCALDVIQFWAFVLNGDDQPEAYLLATVVTMGGQLGCLIAWLLRSTVGSQNDDDRI